MQSIKILEMINSGRIEELKELLREEIYVDTLGKKTDVKKRYAAMKKYFTYVTTAREVFKKPAIVKFNGKDYTSFCNGYSLVLSSEPCGTLELFTDADRYPDTARLVNNHGKPVKIDFNKIIAEAKAKGYKLVKNETSGYKFKYLLHYNNAYFKIGLIDSAYAIINDGEEALVYHDGDSRKQITIETKLGFTAVMPMNLDEVSDDLIIIEASSKDAVDYAL